MVGQRSVLTLALVIAWSSFAGAAEWTQDDLATVKKNVEAGKAVMVDVREPSEWNAGHLEKSISLPLSSFKGADREQLEKKLPQKKIVYTFCVVGKRAVSAANIIEKFGYEVRPLKPGYQQLLEAGFKKAKD